MSQTVRSVAFAMEWVPQYREPFYQALRTELDKRGVNMSLYHGDPPASRKKRNDSKRIEWANHVPNKMWSVKGLELTGQPVLRQIRQADMVVLQQETGLLLNYPMLALSRLGGPLVGLWGHGHNFNPLEANETAERVKRQVTKWADWVFAYTERSAEVFRSLGVSSDKTTVVQNAIDLTQLTNPTGQVTPSVVELVDSLAARGARVGWIVSALDRWKRVPFLVEVLDQIKLGEPDFEFVALGAGDALATLSSAATERPWLHVLGARFGADKAAIGKVAEVTIHPGLVGLHVVESFATETPMITPDLHYHSHEVSYLASDNSVVIDADVSAEQYADHVLKLLSDRPRLDALQRGCRRATSVYTLDAMVTNFADGIEAAIASRQN